jgi:hypothetical protein
MTFVSAAFEMPVKFDMKKTVVSATAELKNLFM